MNNITISLSPEAKKLIKPLVHNRGFSAWVDKQIKKELTNSRMIRDEIILREREIDQLKDQLLTIEEYEKQLKEAEEKAVNVLPIENEYWRDAVNILNNNISYLDGQKALYNNTFNKNVNKTEFIKLYQYWKNELRQKKDREQAKAEEDNKEA